MFYNFPSLLKFHPPRNSNKEVTIKHNRLNNQIPQVVADLNKWGCFFIISSTSSHVDFSTPCRAHYTRTSGTTLFRKIFSRRSWMCTTFFTSDKSSWSLISWNLITCELSWTYLFNTETWKARWTAIGVVVVQVFMHTLQIGPIFERGQMNLWLSLPRAPNCMLPLVGETLRKAWSLTSKQTFLWCWFSYDLWWS